MHGPKPETLTLNNAERNALEVLLRRHSTSQQLILRGRIILLTAQGTNTSQIARTLGVSVVTVRSWRRRWVSLQEVSLEDVSVSERLTDVPHSGRPSQITAEQTCQIVAFACEAPMKAGARSAGGRVARLPTK
jgi:putative transposase